MTSLSHDSPRRYFVDGDGQRVLVGLTTEETSEFETLDSLPAFKTRSGQVLWEQSGSAASRQEKRWLELYTKHEQAWHKWKAESRANESRNLPFFN